MNSAAYCSAPKRHGLVARRGSSRAGPYCRRNDSGASSITFANVVRHRRTEQPEFGRQLIGSPSLSRSHGDRDGGIRMNRNAADKRRYMLIDRSSFTCSMSARDNPCEGPVGSPPSTPCEKCGVGHAECDRDIGACASAGRFEDREFVDVLRHADRPAASIEKRPPLVSLRRPIVAAVRQSSPRPTTPARALFD